MKKFSVLLLLITSFLASSCDLFDSVDDVSFDETVYAYFQITETSTNTTGKVYTATQVLDATSNAEIAKYASKIQDISITNVTYSVTDYSSPGAAVLFTDGKLSLGAIGATPTTVASLPSVNLQALNNGAEQSLVIDEVGMAQLGGLLLTNKKIEIKAEGKLSSTPVSCTIRVSFNLAVTADAL